MTPHCLYCAEEQAEIDARNLVIGVPCGSKHDPGDGETTCTLPRDHEGRHTDGGDAWSNP